MFGWGVLKRGVPVGRVLHWQPPDVHIFDTDPSLHYIISYFGLYLYVLMENR